MPSREPGKYVFRLIDGNASGKPSLNGFTVNGEKCAVRDLQDGDRIIFAEAIEVTYEIKSASKLTPEDAKQTLANAEDEMNTIMNTMLAPNSARV